MATVLTKSLKDRFAELQAERAAEGFELTGG